MPHTALLNPEILISIARFIPNHTRTTLAGGVEVKQNQYNDFVERIDAVSYKTLSSLARVSKVWKEPALDSLWREIPNLVPLGTLFPTGTFITKRGADAPVPDRDPWYDTVRDAKVRVSSIKPCFKVHVPTLRSADYAP